MTRYNQNHYPDNLFTIDNHQQRTVTKEMVTRHLIQGTARNNKINNS